MSRSRPVVLVGDPGVGKTTCLRELGTHLAETDATLPLVVRISSYSARDDLEEYIARQNGLTITALRRIITRHETVALVDELNELGASQRIVVDRLLEFSKAHRLMSVIMATRTSSLSLLPVDGLEFVELQPFSNLAMQRFLSDALGEPRASRVQREIDPRMRALASNPLLLSMIVSVFDESGELPAGRSRLFESFTNHLLTSWDRADDDTVPAYVLDDLLVVLAGHLNPAETSHNQLAVDRTIGAALPALNDRYRTSYDFVGVRRRLYASALLRTNGDQNGKIGYVHHSFQEYYAARYMLSQIARGEIDQSVLRARALDVAWKEVIFFLCGLLSDPDPIIFDLIAASRLFVAAECAHNAPFASPTVCDSLIVYLLNAFKYTDIDQASNEAVGYNVIRGLRLMAPRASARLETRIVEDANFFVAKYQDASRYHTLIAPEEESSESLLMRLTLSDTGISLGDVVRSLGARGVAESTPTIAALVLDKECLFRDDAIWAFGELCDETSSLILLGCVDAAEPSTIVAAACNALVRWSRREGAASGGQVPDTSTVVAHLSRYLDVTGSPARESAAFALARIAGSSAAPVLVRNITAASDPRHRAMFICLLGELLIVDAASELADLYPVEPSAHVREDLVHTAGLLLKELDGEGNDRTTLERLVLAALSDEDSAVRLQAVLAASRCRDISTSHPLVNSLLSDEAAYVRRAAQGLIFGRGRDQKLWQTIGVWMVDPKLAELENKLVTFGARAAAIRSALDFLDGEYGAGRIDVGRTMQLRTSYGQDRLMLLAEIQRTISGTELEPLTPAIDEARRTSSEGDAETRKLLVVAATEQGWGGSIADQVEGYRGEITGLIVGVALEVARRGLS